MKDSVRLKANVVDLHALEQSEFIVSAMTRAAKILRQLVAAQSARVENELRAGFTRLSHRGMLSSGTVTRLTADSQRSFLKLTLPPLTPPVE